MVNNKIMGDIYWLVNNKIMGNVLLDRYTFAVLFEATYYHCFC